MDSGEGGKGRGKMYYLAQKYRNTFEKIDLLTS